MARYRGTVQGQRGEASRLGHSRLRMEVGTWQGRLFIDVCPGYIDGKPTDTDYIAIVSESKDGGRCTLYHGKMVDLCDGRDTLVKKLAEQVLKEQFSG